MATTAAAERGLQGEPLERGASAVQAPAPAKQCSCVGIRSCGLCRDPALREALGLHPARSPAEAAPRAELRFAEGGPVACFEDGRIVSACELPVPLTGFELLHDVILDEREEADMLQAMEAWPWQPSQSGRWKQDFGPRANFKKRLIKVPEDFRGLPRYAHTLLGRVGRRCAALSDFQAVECLLLRYDEERGANHDFHVDDTWLWGDRIVGVTLASPTVFTFYEPASNLAVRVPLPRRSAYLISGSARYMWQHGILAEDVAGVRTAMTFRELTPEVAASEMGRAALGRAAATVEPPAGGEATAVAAAAAAA